MTRGAETLLLLDTCGDQGSLAVARDGQVSVDTLLAQRTASGSLLAAIREGLAAAQVGLGDLDGIGVVNGPGSFTGVRVGLAMAKGLCEASGVRLAAVSRLAVLAEAGGLRDGFAVLAAGRGEAYVREVRQGETGVDRLTGLEQLAEIAAERDIVFAEEAMGALMERLPQARRVFLSAVSSLRLVQRCLDEGGSDLQLADANYVRNEEGIYARSQSQR